MRLDAAPQGALGGDGHGIGVDPESRDAELVEVDVPCGLTGEEPVGMFGQAGDHWPRERTLAHVGQRLIVDDVVAVASAQQLEEIAAVLAVGRAEPGRVSERMCKQVSVSLPYRGELTWRPIL